MIRFAWHEYFKSHDVFLMPVAFAPAMLKDESEPLEARKIATPMVRAITPTWWCGFRSPRWPGFQRRRRRLAVPRRDCRGGVQVVGPMWEDATPSNLRRDWRMVGGSSDEGY
jgi:hypothetical protein